MLINNDVNEKKKNMYLQSKCCTSNNNNNNNNIKLWNVKLLCDNGLFMN